MEDLKQLAIDVVENKVFTSNHLPKEAERFLCNIFMPLIFMEDPPKDLALVYEYLEKAGPRAINGYPIFDSCHFLTTEQLKDLNNHIQQYMEIKETWKQK